MIQHKTVKKYQKIDEMHKFVAKSTFFNKFQSISLSFFKALSCMLLIINAFRDNAFRPTCDIFWNLLYLLKLNIWIKKQQRQAIRFNILMRLATRRAKFVLTATTVTKWRIKNNLNFAANFVGNKAAIAHKKRFFCFFAFE